MRPRPDPVSPGQESVWDYPRPAIAEPTSAHVLIVHQGQRIVDSHNTVRTLETSHPPSFYIPKGDIAPGVLRQAASSSVCEWKGVATYWDAVLEGEVLHSVGWSYEDPTPPFALLRGHVAFYAHVFDRCFIDGERVTAQPGRFYGGWITSRVAGPFKGQPGTLAW